MKVRTLACAISDVKRIIEFKGLIVRGNNHSDCAHSCRYCPIGRKRSIITLEHYERFVKRVQQWIAEARPDLQMFHALGYHANHDQADLETMRRLNGDPAIRGITLGGLPWRSDEQLRDWLALLESYGLKTVHATFGGINEVHDRWNNKPGNFDLLMRTLRVSSDMGFKLGQRLLVGKSTLSCLESLLDQLECLPWREGDWRYAMPFFYQTKYQRAQPDVEEDRIDEAERERLPKRIRTLFTNPKEPDNLSEREWIEMTKGQPEPNYNLTSVIRLTADSMDELERKSIGEIVSDLEARTRRAYESIPSYHELLDRYGDRANTTIYSIRRCLDMKWLDMYRAEHPEIHLEQDLTHCWFGG
jgi:hypothetical protein